MRSAPSCPLSLREGWGEGEGEKTPTALRYCDANSHTTAAFNEGIVGVRTSKSFVREERNLDEFRELTDQMYCHAVSNALYSALFLPAVLTLCSIGIGLALCRGGFNVSGGAISLGTLVMFLQYAGFIQNPAQELANTLTQVQGAQASAERIQQLLDTPVDIKDSAAVLAMLARNKAPAPGFAPDGYADTIQSIEFRDDSFACKQGQPVLDHFNLRVEAGQSIANTSGICPECRTPSLTDGETSPRTLPVTQTGRLCDPETNPDPPGCDASEASDVHFDSGAIIASTNDSPSDRKAAAAEADDPSAFEETPYGRRRKPGTGRSILNRILRILGSPFIYIYKQLKNRNPSTAQKWFDKGGRNGVAPVAPAPDVPRRDA